jgi:hypothetical protein
MSWIGTYGVEAGLFGLAFICFIWTVLNAVQSIKKRQNRDR